jgi:hypothetical protein
MIGEAAADGQPEPGAAVLARGRDVGLDEGWNRPALLVRPDADAGILDLEADLQSSPVSSSSRAAQNNAAALGELDGVAGEVEQAWRSRVGSPRSQDGTSPASTSMPAPWRAPVADQRTRMVENRRQRKVGLFQRQLAGLDLGQVEDVIDDRQQMVAAVSILPSRSACSGLVSVRAADGSGR